MRPFFYHQKKGETKLQNYENRNEERFGSARWAEYDDIEAAGLFKNEGTPFGFFDNRLLRYDSDSPRICIGGSGSGKLASLLAYTLCLPNTMPMAVLDPRAELWSVSVLTLAQQGIYAYNWNPYNEKNIVGHSINPLEHLTPDNPMLFAETNRLFGALIPMSGGGNAKYFELTAQNLLTAISLQETYENEKINFPRLHELINMVEGNLSEWADFLERMAQSHDPYLRSAAFTINNRQVDAPKEFGSVMAEIYAYMMWLNDPKIRKSLEGGDASLSELVDGNRPVRIHFTVPGSLLEFCSPILRVFFESIMTLKSVRPDAERVMLLIDEAAALGNFAALRRAYTYGRGDGIVPFALFQDLGQLRAFGPTGVQTFLGSSALRLFIGIREIASAHQISQSCGCESLIYDDEARQAQAWHQRQAQISAFLNGEDVLETARAFDYFNENAQRGTTMRRQLITPDEVLNMREDQMIAFISGKNLPPILGNKYPYFQRRETAYRYLPNPVHPPLDRVKVQGAFGSKWINVQEIPVPEKYSHFPQYRSGTALQLQGHPI